MLLLVPPGEEEKQETPTCHCIRLLVDGKEENGGKVRRADTDPQPMPAEEVSISTWVSGRRRDQ